MTEHARATGDWLIEESNNAHAIARAKGWWPSNVYDRDPIEVINNFRGEIAEAWEEYRSNRMGLWWSDPTYQGPPLNNLITNQIPDEQLIEQGFKPEGFWIEVADLCIRVMDAIGAYVTESSIASIQRSNEEIRIIPKDSTENFFVTHFIDALYNRCDRLAQLELTWSEGWSSVERAVYLHHLAQIVYFADANAGWYSVHLLDMIDLKTCYNKTRGYRHGGKLA